MQEPCLLVGIWAGVRGQSQVAWEASWGEKNMFGLVLMKGRVEGSWSSRRHFQPEAWDLWGMVGPCCPLCAGAAAPTPNCGRLPALVPGIPACMRFAPRAAELLFVQGEPFIW